MNGRKSGISLHAARLTLYCIWLVLFVFYALMFLSRGNKDGIKPQEADEGAWNVIYILAPVMVAFGVFFLGPQANKNLEADKHRRATLTQLFVMLTLTLGCHAVTIYYFWNRVWFADFNFNNDPGRNFVSAANFGFKMLLFLGNIPVLAVNYVLGRTDVEYGRQTHATERTTDIHSR